MFIKAGGLAGGSEAVDLVFRSAIKGPDVGSELSVAIAASR